MKKIRIGNDINISWTVKRFGNPESFAGMSLEVLLISPTGKSSMVEFSTEGNVIKTSFLGMNQEETGAYALVLVENGGQLGMTTIDTVNAFILVPHTFMEGGSDGSGIATTTDDVNITSEITVPADGKSAYEIAVLHGFEGTENQWLASLKGEPGKDGSDANVTKENVINALGYTPEDGTDCVKLSAEQTIPGKKTFVGEIGIEKSSEGNNGGVILQAQTYGVRNKTDKIRVIGTKGKANIEVERDPIEDMEVSTMQYTRNAVSTEATRAKKVEATILSTMDNMQRDIDESVNKSEPQMILKKKGFKEGLSIGGEDIGTGIWIEAKNAYTLKVSASPDVFDENPFLVGLQTHSDRSSVVTRDYVDDEFQKKLISGTNIKTINSQSILGSGNINISGGSAPKSMPWGSNDKVIVHKSIPKNARPGSKYFFSSVITFRMEDGDRFTMGFMPAGFSRTSSGQCIIVTIPEDYATLSATYYTNKNVNGLYSFLMSKGCVSTREYFSSDTVSPYFKVMNNKIVCVKPNPATNFINAGLTASKRGKRGSDGASEPYSDVYDYLSYNLGNDVTYRCRKFRKAFSSADGRDRMAHYVYHKSHDCYPFTIIPKARHGKLSCITERAICIAKDGMYKLMVL